MKKRIKKIASCILTFIFVLTPLMFTGCMSIVLDLLLGEKAGASTYYLGGLYSGGSSYVSYDRLQGYLNGWYSGVNNLATAFRQEFGTNTNGDRNIDKDTANNLSGRTDYFPDYKTLIGTSVEPKEIASLLYTYQYMVCYTVGITGSHFVLALSDNDKVTETTTNADGEVEYIDKDFFFSRASGNLEFDSRLIAVEDGKFVAKLDNSKDLLGIFKYYDDLELYSYFEANDIKKDTVLYDMSTDTGCKVFKFSCKYNNETYTCSFAIGNTSDFISAFDDTDTGSQSLAESIENCLYQLYDTHYGLADYYWIFEKDQINLYINSNLFLPVRAEQSKVNSFLKTNSPEPYGLAVDIIKELLVGDDIDSLKSFVPTSLTITAISQVIQPVLKDESTLPDESGKITAVSLYDIYRAVINLRTTKDKPEYLEIKDSKGTESIYVALNIDKETNEDDRRSVEQLFIVCTYQFFNGIWGFKDNDNNRLDVVNAIVNGVIYKNNKDYTEKFTNFMRKKQRVRIETSTIAVNLKAISAYLVNNDREIEIDADTAGAFIVSVTGEQISDADENNANYKNFFADEKRKYNSLIFEAWGRNYALNAISFQIEYLTEAEKELEEKNKTESTVWQNIRDHYTFVVEKYVYCKDEGSTDGGYMKKEASFAKKVSEMFTDDTIKSGFFFCYFKDMLANNKNALGSEILSLDSVVSSEKSAKFGSSQELDKKPFALIPGTNPSTSYYLTEYDDATYGKSVVYSRSLYCTRGEEFIQLIFAVDNEAYRIPFRFTSILMGG